MKYLILVWFFFTSFAFTEDDHHDEHHDEVTSLEAHEHGIGKMNIAQDNTKILIEFELPGADIVGFEHKAETKEDIKNVNNALSLLSKYENLVKLPLDAKCSIENASANILHEGNHGEFRSQYILDCQNPGKIQTIELLYFERFPNSKELNVSIVSDKKAESLVAKKDNYKLSTVGYFD